MTTRVPPVVPGTRAELAAIESSVKAQRGNISLLYQVLLNSAPLAEGWEKMLTAVRNHSSVPADIREMVILRVAILNHAPFEFEAHAPIARKVGVTEAKLAALRETNPGDAFTPLERAVFALTDAMTRDVQIPDPLFEPLRAYFDDRALVELVATVAAYMNALPQALRIGR
jgi:AhpD family alkylhydroperoxidase